MCELPKEGAYLGPIAIRCGMKPDFPTFFPLLLFYKKHLPEREKE